MTDKWKINIVVSLLLVVAGSLVYLLFRQNIILFDLLEHPKWLQTLSIEIQTSNGFVCYFFLYCFSDMVWYAALLLLASTFYIKGNKTSTILLVFSVVLPFIIEGMQFCRLFPGTFDWYDIFSYLITFIIFILIWT